MPTSGLELRDKGQSLRQVTEEVEALCVSKETAL